MVIGTGMMAKAFSRYNDDSNVLIFASGVAYSGETNNSQFDREKSALIDALNANAQSIFVYFSSCGMYDSDSAGTPYILHKIHMENLINQLHSNYLIFRVPQVVGISSNRMTLVNFLYDKIVNGEEFTIWTNASRYLIDVDDVAKIAGYIIDNAVYQNMTINIALLKYSIIDIVNALEKVTKKQAVYRTVTKGTPYDIDNSAIMPIIKEFNISCDDIYLLRMLSKYYLR